MKSRKREHALATIDKNSLLGKSAVIEFPESIAKVHFSQDRTLFWHVTDKHKTVTKGEDRFSYLQISDHLHLLNWLEKTGFTVTHEINTQTGITHAMWTRNDPGGEIKRSAAAVKGRFRFVESIV